VSAKKLSKTRKLAVHREIRSMTKNLDTCAELDGSGRLDVVDLLANLNKIEELMSQYRKVLVKECEAEPSLAAKYDAYRNALAKKAMQQVGKHFQAMFDANPDLLRGDVIEVTANDVERPALAAPSPLELGTDDKERQ
jgi:hypothetical protein